jgi:hypothetical protein
MSLVLLPRVSCRIGHLAEGPDTEDEDLTSCYPSVQARLIHNIYMFVEPNPKYLILESQR